MFELSIHRERFSMDGPILPALGRIDVRIADHLLQFRLGSASPIAGGTTFVRLVSSQLSSPLFSTQLKHGFYKDWVCIDQARGGFLIGPLCRSVKIRWDSMCSSDQWRNQAWMKRCNLKQVERCSYVQDITLCYAALIPRDPRH